MFSIKGYRNKKLLLIAGTALFAVLCWKLALQNTLDAIMLNRSLERQTGTRESLAVSPEYLRERQHTLNILLNTYRVDTADWYSRFWTAASGVALHHEAGISYDPFTARALTDTTQRFLRQTATFSGDYLKCVAILDSLEHIPDIGKVSKVTLNGAEGRRDEPQKPLMTVELRALPPAP